ncbi:uroporphyrinogen-III synthase [Luteimonas sp. SX5]|uniref:Uroporphyrinogen-III synthase n=1 Tax=Luteimonas galliterrae TaxID=2940486 RepID=A0ABT0MLV8_9GAMM|nr:uroporphyrinogen-III synthase [Luteimonas galliterrae]MCL1635868.1 uroporphyrinogen-III synthase [Luteimonas galliterrae]
MPRANATDKRLAGWQLISLRPAGEHAPLRRAAAARGARVLALSPWRLRLRDDPATRAALRAALQAQRVVFTSPAAVKAAAAMRRLRAGREQVWLAVGEGTARALRRAGVARVVAPARMDSEGLLALPDLQRVRGLSIGLVTAPGGRGAIAPALAARGARILRCDAYEREPIAWTAATLARLRALSEPYALAVSSAEALRLSLNGLPPELADKLRGARAVAASPRLAAVARAAGFTDVIVADSPQPADLVAAAARAVARLPLA